MQFGVVASVMISALLDEPKRHSLTIANICSLGSSKPAAQTRVGNSERLIGREPPRIRTLAFTRMRVVVASEQQIAQVEMTMTARARVHINMDQLRPIVRMHDSEPEFFVRLAHRGPRRVFAIGDVPARLQPQLESFVHVQRDTAAPNDDRRRRHMANIGVLAER